MFAPKVYVVLVNWNGWKDTILCLDSLLRSDYPNFQAIVCDNGSEDDSVERIKAWAEGKLASLYPPDFPPNCTYSESSATPIPYIEASIAQNGTTNMDRDARLILMRTGHNLGFGGANNIAFRYIQQRKDADYVWLLNNDTVVPKDTLSIMVRDAAGHCGITGSLIRGISAPHIVQTLGGGYISPLTGLVRTERTKKSTKLGYICGASFMLDRRVLDAVGLFDENIFMYFEDADYCIRAQRLGFTMRASEATVFHKIGGASEGNAFAWKHTYRNKIYVLLKHYGFRWWVLGSALSWLAQLANPFASPAKKQASREALGCLRTAFGGPLFTRSVGCAGDRG